MSRVLSLTGPHVRYLQKPDDSPCSITDSVKRFPKEDATEGNATSPPQNPPTNLTVVTVEGCPSFVILDWEKPLNDTVTGKIMAWGLLWWEALVIRYPGSGVPWVNVGMWSVSGEEPKLAVLLPLRHIIVSSVIGWEKIIFVLVMGSLLI